MSKKDFSGGLSSVLGDQPEKKKPGRPKTSTKIPEKSSEEGTKEGETRATFIVNKELLEDIKAIAYWDRLLIRDVIETALQETRAKYIKKNGELKPIPKK